MGRKGKKVDREEEEGGEEEGEEKRVEEAGKKEREEEEKEKGERKEDEEEGDWRRGTCSPWGWDCAPAALRSLQVVRAVPVLSCPQVSLPGTPRAAPRGQAPYGSGAEVGTAGFAHPCTRAPWSRGIGRVRTHSVNPEFSFSEVLPLPTAQSGPTCPSGQIEGTGRRGRCRSPQCGCQ